MGAGTIDRVGTEGSQGAAPAQGRSDAAARRIRAGVTWIGVLAVMLAVAAPIQFAMSKLDADEALAEMGAPADSQEAVAIGWLPVELGVRNLEAALAINGLLAAAMGGLWLWGRRNARPALTGALALVVLPLLANAIWQPRALLRGLVSALITLILFGRGLNQIRLDRAAVRRNG